MKSPFLLCLGHCLKTISKLFRNHNLLITIIPPSVNCKLSYLYVNVSAWNLDPNIAFATYATKRKSNLLYFLWRYTSHATSVSHIYVHTDYPFSLGEDEPVINKKNKGNWLVEIFGCWQPISRHPNNQGIHFPWVNCNFLDSPLYLRVCILAHFLRYWWFRY